MMFSKTSLMAFACMAPFVEGKFARGDAVFTVDLCHKSPGIRCTNSTGQYHHKRGKLIRKPFLYEGKQGRWEVRFKSGETRLFTERQMITPDAMQRIRDAKTTVSRNKWGTNVIRFTNKSVLPGGNPVREHQTAHICHIDDELKLIWSTPYDSYQVDLEDLSAENWDATRISKAESPEIRRKLEFIKDEPKRECMLCKSGVCALAADDVPLIQFSCKCAWFCADCLKTWFRQEAGEWGKWMDIQCPYRDVRKAGRGSRTHSCPTHGDRELPEEDIQKWAQFVPEEHGQQSMLEWKAWRDREVAIEMRSMYRKWHATTPTDKWNKEQGNGDLTKPCPSTTCNRHILKTGGCDHMTCERKVGGCGLQFCWLCGKRYVRNDKRGNIKLPQGFCSTHCQRDQDRVVASRHSKLIAVLRQRNRNRR